MSNNLILEKIFHKQNIGVGKRKRSIARIFLISGKGNIIINKELGEKYLQYNRTYLNTIWAPLKVLNLETQFDIIAIVNGGGLTSQAKAIQLGIARLICQKDSKNRLILKLFGFLTRDARIKERKKYGLRKARKAPQYSKR
jgi:small subunit ribosomal protein S9